MFWSPDLVEAMVAGDPEQEGPEFGTRPVAAGAAIQFQEDFLGELLRYGLFAHESIRKAHHARLVAVEEGSKSALIACCCLQHQLGVGIALHTLFKAHRRRKFPGVVCVRGLD